jgi:hypothetical protein
MTTADQTRPSTTENNFDADSMREKYRRERDKRIRADGNDQYTEVTGDFAHFVDDPYVQPGYKREPVLDDVDVLLIGGGFGGQQGKRIAIIGTGATAVQCVPHLGETAEEAWVQTILEKGAGGAILGGEGCTPGYYNNEGKPNPLAAQAMPYGGGPVQFFGILKKWREQGHFEGLEFKSG